MVAAATIPAEAEAQACISIVCCVAQVVPAPTIPAEAEARHEKLQWTLLKLRRAHMGGKVDAPLASLAVGDLIASSVTYDDPVATSDSLGELQDYHAVSTRYSLMISNAQGWSENLAPAAGEVQDQNCRNIASICKMLLRCVARMLHSKSFGNLDLRLFIIAGEGDHHDDDAVHACCSAESWDMQITLGVALSCLPSYNNVGGAGLVSDWVDIRRPNATEDRLGNSSKGQYRLTR